MTRFTQTTLLTAATIFLSLLVSGTASLPARRAPPTNNSSNANDLIYVQLIFRHGDRAPDKFYANSPSVNSWPQGAGQMTPLGIQQLYALGTFLRHRYADYLALETTGVAFSDVYVRASDEERTITAAQTNIAAFFKPPASNKNPLAEARAWNTTDSDLGTLWSPLPIHLEPKDTDFFMQEAKCERLDKLKKDFENSQTIQNIRDEKDVKNLLHRLADATGEKYHEWTLTDTFKDVADTLACESRHNITLPDVDVGFYDEVAQLAQRVWPLQFADDHIASLRGGCLLGHLANHMSDKLKGKTDGTYNSRKLVAYSTHDKTIMGVLSSAGLYDKVVGKSPPFAAAAFFELYADGMVEISYKDDSSSLDAIRTVEPRVLVRAQLDDLLHKWKHTAIDGDDCEKACKK